MAPRKRIAVVFGTVAGAGGLGLQVATAISGLATSGHEVHAFGPGYTTVWPLANVYKQIRWHFAPRGIGGWRSRYGRLRWNPGRLQLKNDLVRAQWAVREIARLKPELCYAFTQVGCETLRLCRQEGIPTILDNPNGHIRNFRHVYERETSNWCCSAYRGHPVDEMIERIEEEYGLARKIRVSSEWSRRSMLGLGEFDAKVSVLNQPIDLERFRPSRKLESDVGPLRVCFVGSLDLRKGFVYLLRAIRLIGAKYVALTMVGATGDRCSKTLLSRESAGLQVTCLPGDPTLAFQSSELSVVPSLEDGQPFATGEAMASGLPVIVSSSCGSADWIKSGRSGWVVEPASAEGIATALERALLDRHKLADMGAEARRAIELRAGPHVLAEFAEWALEELRGRPRPSGQVGLSGEESEPVVAR
jgi:glycosyltransferase involved in cell wall biosynthesis